MDRRTIKREPLAPEQRKRFSQAVYNIYNAIGPDSGWTEKTPSKAVFVDVILDKMDAVYLSELTDNELRLWATLSKAEQRRIILEVGP